MKHFLLAATMLLAGGLAAAENDSDWPRWRGPRDNGSTDTGKYPVKWDANTHLLWKVPLPGKGCSTPIVWNQRIFVTAPVEGQDALLAFDASGKPLWQTTFGSELKGRHRNGSGCILRQPPTGRASSFISRAAISRQWTWTASSAGRPT